MELLCLGLNHRTAPVEVREKFAISPTLLGEAATEMLTLAGAAEAVVISTCNRTEFYLAAANASSAFLRMESSLASKIQLDSSVTSHFYRKEKSAAALHLCRVVSGLDSMMLGETEIFGQVKQAYQVALNSGATGIVLNKLFQRAFGVGKKVRSETAIQEGSTSVGSVAVSLVSRGAKSIFVANRSYDRAEELATEMGGRAVRFDDWQAVLERVDVVISSTGAPHAIVQRADVEKVRRARKYRPLFFIDIAVPRDIDPAVGEIEEVYLYDIDTLEQLAEEARARRQEQIEECEKIICLELSKLNLPGI